MKFNKDVRLEGEGEREFEWSGFEVIRNYLWVIEDWGEGNEIFINFFVLSMWRN